MESPEERKELAAGASYQRDPETAVGAGAGTVKSAVRDA
jgi:hypothetical protein